MNQENTTGQYDGSALSFGVDPALYNRLSPTQRSMLDLYAGKSQLNIANGARAQNITPQLLTTFYQDAVNDPTIDKYYKDQLALGQRELQMNLEYINAKDTLEKEKATRQYEDQRMADDEAAAAAGTAYSSYRNRTDENRRLDQFGVTDLRNRQNKLQAFNLGNAFEQNFGSANAGNISVGGQQYNPLGNLLGSNEQNKLSSINSLARENAQSFLSAGGLPNTTSLPLATMGGQSISSATPTLPSEKAIARGNSGYTKQQSLLKKGKITIQK